MQQAQDQQFELVSAARNLRRDGHRDDAVALLQQGWQQAAAIGLPAGWIALELADLCLDAAELAQAAQWAQAAALAHEATGDWAGRAAAALLAGDLAWATADGASARSHWAHARSLADASGAGPLAGRALLALALTDLGGDAAVVEAQLEAAESRVTLVPGVSDDLVIDAWRGQADAVRASLALVRARHAIAGRRWPEARLLLSAAAQAAGAVGDLALYAHCLRVDAVLARKAGDPNAAVAALRLAERAAGRSGSAVLGWLCRAELALALLEDESLAEAAALIPAAVPDELAAVPAVAAAVLEAFAALAVAGGQAAAAEPALYRAVEERVRIGDKAGEVRALALLADALRHNGAAAEANQVLRQVHARADASGRADLMLVAHLAQVRLAGDATTPALAARCVALAGQAGSVTDQLAALDAAADAELRLGERGRAVAMARQAVALAAEQPLLRLRARTAARLAWALAASDADPAQTQAALHDAAQLAETAGDLEARARAHLVAAHLFAAQGRLDEAALVASRAAEAAAAARRSDLQAEAWCALGTGFAGARQFAEASAAFGRAAQCAGVGAAGAAVAALRGLAWCARESGDPASALGNLAQALEIAAAAGLTTAGFGAAVDEAQVLLASGELDRARTRLNELDLRAAPAAVRGEALALLAQVAARQRQWARADDLATRALQDLRGSAQPRALGAALYAAGQIAGAVGDGTRAGALLGEALGVAVRAGLPEQAMIRATIARLTSPAAAVQDPT